MAGTVVAVFGDHRQAERAAEALLKEHVPLNDISLVCKDAGGETGAPEIEGDQPAERHEEYLSRAVREVHEHDVEEPQMRRDDTFPRATVGVVAGVPLGALLVASAVFVPGLGALMAMGPLAAMMTGGIAGGLIGGLVGGLTAGGIPEAAAKSYHEHVEKGDCLVTVLTSRHNAGHIQEVLQQQGGSETAFFARFLDSIQSMES